MDRTELLRIAREATRTAKRLIEDLEPIQVGEIRARLLLDATVEIAWPPDDTRTAEDAYATLPEDWRRKASAARRAVICAANACAEV